MAEQTRKFGARLAELRAAKGWEQKHLVAAMAKRGDQSLNTNQLSRYENGGALPRPDRQELFADALDTTVGDLMAGPLADRSQRDTPDLMRELSPDAGLQEAVASLEGKLDRVLERLAAVAASVEQNQQALRQLQQASQPQRGRKRQGGGS